MLKIYQRGSVNVIKGSATVTGSDTRWLKHYVQPGDRFKVIADIEIYTVQEVVNRRRLILTTAYQGADIEDAAYQIDKLNIANAAKLARAQAAKIKAIKQQARLRISDIAQPWKQRNLLARGLELQHQGPDTWSAEEIAESDTIKAIWTNIKAVRSQSDNLEAQVEATIEIADVDEIEWP